MQKRIYEEDPYTTCWEAEITGVRERDGRLGVALSETAFYPGGGGQPADRGAIGECQVLDIFEEGGTIFHVVPSLPGDGTVTCRLDWSGRFDHMQQHTGQHLLSSAFYHLCRGETSGFHLGEEYVTADIALERISQEMTIAVEDWANDYIYKNIAVTVKVLAPGEASALPLRKMPPEAGLVRVVEIDGIDFSPCCGTHVSRTGEIGMVRILKTEKYKGMIRVYFVCGRRCLRDYRQKSGIITDLSRQLSASGDGLPGQVEKLAGTARELSREVRELKEELSGHEASRLVNEGKGVLSAFYRNKKADDLQIIARHTLQMAEGPVLLASLPDKKIIICHSGKTALNCGKLFKEHLKEFNGRGGGSDRQAQAMFESVDDLLVFGEFIEKVLLEPGSGC